MKSQSAPIAIVGGTILDGNGGAPIRDGVIVAEGARITAVGDKSTPIPPGAQTIPAAGKYVIPGLLDANVHLLLDVRMENLVRHEGRYEDLIAEAAQIALRAGLTTVFDSWGPRQSLMRVRDRIDSGEIPGSRIFCAGNIIGLDGPYSLDFLDNTLGTASAGLVHRINAIWAENVGPDLTWMTPEQVVEELRTYIARGVDFIKVACSEHRGQPNESTTSLLFSPLVQSLMVGEAHRAGLTAQSHISSVESLRVSLEAGYDIIQHCNTTGPVPIPDSTVELMVRHKTGCVIFPFTERRWKMIQENSPPMVRRLFSTREANTRAVMQSGALVLLGTDAGVRAPDCQSDPKLKNSWGSAGEDNLAELGQGHFAWLKAMEEKGFPAMEALKAATKNIAVAYKKDKDFGTLEAGKFADMVILDKDPLQSSAHYRSIHMVLKEGAVVDREALPLNPILTGAGEDPDETSTYYGKFAFSKYPSCC